MELGWYNNKLGFKAVFVLRTTYQLTKLLTRLPTLLYKFSRRSYSQLDTAHNSNKKNPPSQGLVHQLEFTAVNIGECKPNGVCTVVATKKRGGIVLFVVIPPAMFRECLAVSFRLLLPQVTQDTTPPGPMF